MKKLILSLMFLPFVLGLGAPATTPRQAGAAGVTDVLPNGNGAAFTEEDITVLIDSSTGTDPAAGTSMINQAQATALGTFQTLAGVVEALPENIRHQITAQYTDGDHVLTTKYFADFNRLNFSFNTDPETDTNRGRIIVTSENGLARVSGTSTYGIASASGDTVTLDSDPGFVADTYRGYFMRISSGTGSGQYRAIRAHTTTSWQIAYNWSPYPDNSSEMEIIEPSAEIKFIAGEFDFYINGESFDDDFWPWLDFQAIDLSRDGGGLTNVRLTKASVKVSNGARFLKVFINARNSSVTLGLCVFDTISGTLSTNGAISINGGYVSSTGADTAVPLLTGLHGYGISLYGGVATSGITSAAFLNDIVIDRFQNGIILDERFATLQTGDDVRGDSISQYGIKITAGARANLDLTAIQLADQITGATSDMQIDGVDVTFATVDADADDMYNSLRNSVVDGNF